MFDHGVYLFLCRTAWRHPSPRIPARASQLTNGQYFIVSMEGDCLCWNTAANEPIIHPADESIYRCSGMILTEKNRWTPRKMLTTATLSITNPTWTNDLDGNLGLRGEKLVTSRLNYGMAKFISCSCLHTHSKNLFFPWHGHVSLGNSSVCHTSFTLISIAIHWLHRFLLWQTTRSNFPLFSVCIFKARGRRMQMKKPSVPENVKIWCHFTCCFVRVWNMISYIKNSRRLSSGMFGIVVR
jgi:hypothetical protein